MDCQLPVMDGYTATRKIREQERFQKLPVIAMTANVLSGDREKAIDSGMNDHIGKPVNPSELFSIIGKWISPSKKEQTNLNLDDSGDDYIEIPQIEGLDTEKGLSIVQNNKRAYIKILLKFKDMYENFIQLFNDALKESDPDAATRLAHSLKGSAGNIGAGKLFNAAAELETRCRTKDSKNNIDNQVQIVVGHITPLIEEIKKFYKSIIAPGIEKISQFYESAIQDKLNDVIELLEDYDTEAINRIADLSTNDRRQTI